MFNFNNQDSCFNGCMSATPTYQQCNNVVQTYNYQDVPHVTNYHTHTVNNCIKRHINIPTYSQSSENIYMDEYVQGQPMYMNYQQPVMYNQPTFNQGMMNQQMVYSQNQYQGNVASDGYKPMPYQEYKAPNFMNPYSNM